MAEGPIHVALVQLILSLLSPSVAGGDYAVSTDNAGESRNRRCPVIGGYIPDVYAVATRDLQMRVIGEAKVGKDFESPRTEPQMLTFLSFLATFERATLIFAVPFKLLPAASTLAARAAKQTPNVRVLAVAPHVELVISKGWQ